MLLGLETFSYYLAFAYGEMDIFSFIRRAAELGLDGVQINLEGPNWGHLGDDSPDFLRRVRALTDDLGLYVELDVAGTEPDHLGRALDICLALGADRLRLYASFGGDLAAELARAVVDLKTIAPAFARAGVRIAFENHEYETSADILGVIEQVDSPVVGAHIDTGNSMMVREDPIAAVAAMAPHVVSTHFKDHLVIEVGGQPMIAGVPLGAGKIDLTECYRLLAGAPGLERINIEVCYGYLAPFRCPPGEGGGAELGQGAFEVARPPFDPRVIAPHLLRPKEDGLKSYAWSEIADMSSDPAERERLMNWQAEAVETSVEHVKRIRREVESTD